MRGNEGARDEKLRGGGIEGKKVDEGRFVLLSANAKNGEKKHFSWCPFKNYAENILT